MPWISTLPQSMAPSLRHKSEGLFAVANVKSYAQKISFWVRQLDATFAILESTQKTHSTWWFQNVYVFTVKIGEMIQLDYLTYFSDGLKKHQLYIHWFLKKYFPSASLKSWNGETAIFKTHRIHVLYGLYLLTLITSTSVINDVGKCLLG